MIGIEATARAKVNLTLHVLGRRTDGYHSLDSVVAFADIGDTVRLLTGKQQGVFVYGPFATAVLGENLVATAVSKALHLAPGLEVGSFAIDKVLPVAAGIGGGSADAAAALKLLRRINRPVSDGIDWMALAARIGSDVPVCFLNRACRMSGRGEHLDPLEAFPHLPAVLVNPCVRVPPDKTRQVFERLAAPAIGGARPDSPPEITGRFDAAGWMKVIAAGRNDLEAPATAVVPAIADVLAAIRAHPATQLARLSGAGPTCFGLARSIAEAEALASDLAKDNPAWWVRATVLS